MHNTFKLVYNSHYDPSQSILAFANNKYVTAETGGSQPLIANRTAIGPWERFSFKAVQKRQGPRLEWRGPCCM